jgi:hypothetical protein
MGDYSFSINILSHDLVKSSPGCIGSPYMKLVKVVIELGVDDEYCLNDTSTDGNYYDKEKIAKYLSDQLYMDPEYFGDFGPENIESVTELE